MYVLTSVWKLNVIEGVYPAKPILTTGFDKGKEDAFIAGNEGVAQVLKAAPSLKAKEHPLKEGD